MSYISAGTEGRTKDAPLIFTFHGTGGNETQFHSLASELMPDASVVSPRGDVLEGSMARFFKRTGEGVYDMEDLARRTTAMAAFMSAEKAQTANSRTIGLGYSNGANILAAVALTHPEITDELILMHPLIPWAPAPQPGLKDRRVLITAGKRDPICPAAQTMELANYLTAQGAQVTLHWHEGGHEIAPAELAAIQLFLTP